MRKILLISILIVLLAGCAASPAGSSPTQTPERTPKPTKEAGDTSAVTLNRGTFTLTIFTPIDRSVVSTPAAEIKGELSADAVLSINNDIYVLPAGTFTESVPLVSGSNEIEIVASDMSGAEVDLILTVIYQP
jgi:hypothetical protein